LIDHAVVIDDLCLIGKRVAMSPSDKTRQKIAKTDAEWQKLLTPAQYRVARRHGTERAFSGPYWNEKAAGLYNCVCCGSPLFSSETKFDSGTGWPSFWAPVEKDAVTEHDDRSFFFIRRTEIRCSACDAHLGHVFPDGPKPTGARYCMNGTALSFTPSGHGDKS
jgi:peptide-methionine (R)-S-oxide reductase